MNLPSIQKFRGISRAVVNNLTMPQIQFTDSFHIRITQHKIPDIQIFFHTFSMNRFRNNDNPPLHIPPQGHLCSALSIFRSDFTKNRMGKDSMLSFRHRAPCLRLHTKFFHNGKRVCLCKKRMQLYLVDHRPDFCVQA